MSADEKPTIGRTHEIVQGEKLGAEAYWLYEITYVDEATYAVVTHYIACDANLYLEDLVRLLRDDSFEQDELVIRLLSAEGQSHSKIGTILSVRQMFIDFFIRPISLHREDSCSGNTDQSDRNHLNGNRNGNCNDARDLI